MLAIGNINFLHNHCAFYSQFYTSLGGKKPGIIGGRNYLLEYRAAASG